MKVVKNACYGGFGLSGLAITRLAELTGKHPDDCIEDYENDMDNRTAPELVQVVEELGKEASDSYAHLIVVEIPDDVEWYIDSYKGWETIEEVHRSW